MYQAQWGQKFICPECSAKFYSMGKMDGLNCPSCGTNYDIQANRKLKNNQMLKNAPPALLDDEVIMKPSADAKSDDVFAEKTEENTDADSGDSADTEQPADGKAS